MTLLVLSIIPSFYTIKKVLNLKSLNIFDLLQLSNTLYFGILPIKEIISENISSNNYNIVNNITSFYFLLFNLLLLFLNIFLTIKYKYKYNIINITNYIYYINSNIKLSRKYVYLYIIFFIILAIQFSDYSLLSEENLEKNITDGYGLNQGIFKRIWLVFVYNTYPIFILLNFKYVMDNYSDKLSKLSLLIGVITAFFGTKTMLFSSIMTLLIYYYSVNKEKINGRFILLAIGTMLVLNGIVFPTLQTFRLVKHSLVLNYGKTSFVSVLNNTFIENKLKKEVGEKLLRYNNRTLNVYQTLNWACTRNYRGEGDLSLIVYKYIIPQKIENVSELNTLGNVYMFDGADVGESVLAWFVADLGLFGIFCALFFFLISLYIWRIYILFFLKIFNDKKIYFFYIYFLIQLIINVENNPSTFFHGFYSHIIISLFAYTFSFKLFDVSSKILKK